MSRIELLLVQMYEAYQRLSRHLDGLTDEEYLWQPVPDGWSIRRGDGGRWGDRHNARPWVASRSSARTFVLASKG